MYFSEIMNLYILNSKIRNKQTFFYNASIRGLLEPWILFHILYQKKKSLTDGEMQFHGRDLTCRLRTEECSSL